MSGLTRRRTSETDDRLFSLVSWREAPRFTPAEPAVRTPPGLFRTAATPT